MSNPTGPQVYDDEATIDALGDLHDTDHIRVETGHDLKTGNPIYKRGYHVETLVLPDSPGSVNLKHVNEKGQIVITPSHRLPADVVPAPGVKTGADAPQIKGKPQVKDGK